ncbi:ATPase, T2SS/T4P/T4SS family [Elusimicrobiota bacterium]
MGEEDAAKMSSKLFKMPVTDLRNELIDTSITKIIPYEVARRHGVLPVRREKNLLIVAMSDPVDVVALDNIQSIVNANTKTFLRLKPILSRKSQISESIGKIYNADDMIYDLLKNVIDDKENPPDNKKKDNERMEVSVLQNEHGPVARLINFVLNDGIKARTSDIHIEPQEDSIRIRYKVDGDLREIIKVPRNLLHSLIARIKVMARLDLAETRKPQDGRSSITVFGRNIDLRISVIPTFHGEKVVIRVLDPDQVKVRLNELGFAERELNMFMGAAKKPQGMILLTGPTGAGKTLTLYAGLNYIKNDKVNIITIEDPVEYMLDGLTQIQVNPVKDVTFASGLKSILRQDPNVILVGEIRDKETAEIAFKSSLTGHLVFSALHANSSVSAITRLLDLGLEPYLISSSLILIVAQRLVKLICPHCKVPYTPDEETMNKCRNHLDKLNIREFYRGGKCKECNYSGFLSRTAIFELLKINEPIRNIIINGGSGDEVLREAKKQSFRSLMESGMEKVAQGLTTLEEVLNVADIEQDSGQGQSPDELKRKRKILIADDEENIRDVLESRFENMGYEVVSSKNGREAVESAFKEKPDLIIMDVMMPEMNGYEATKVLRSKLETASIPILMLTAKKDVESEIKGLNLGADDYMGKPFEGERLIARVNMLLKRRYNDDSLP